jgi:DNA polymerase V
LFFNKINKISIPVTKLIDNWIKYYIHKTKEVKKMEQDNHIYIAIDLKSFYASVECLERGLDPLSTNLVVADASRTEKTICLAVAPSLKTFGISGRARLFEVVQKVKEANAIRRSKAPNQIFAGSSYNATELKDSPELAIDYIAAPPRMALYMDYSTRIYNIYLKYVAPEDIHVYSIDEVFMDVTNYLQPAKLSAREYAMNIISEVYQTIGITATAGIGTNLYLCKIAMDIVAKHIPPDKDGVRIAELDEMSYRRMLWTHKPLTDFWRVGRGYAKKLEENGMFTMGDVARCSIGKKNEYHNEDLLYKLFGINAELLIDHAWGWEPCTIADVKAYKPATNSIGSGQVLQYPYTYEKAKLIVREMTDLLVLDLVDKGLVTDQMVLTVGYDIENLSDPEIRKKYNGPITTDYYGRQVPKHAHGTVNLNRHTSSTKLIIDAVMDLYTRIMDKNLLVRRINIAANHVVNENNVEKDDSFEQLDLFTDYEATQKEKEKEDAALLREKKMQLAMLDIKKKFGKNAILKGTNLEEGAMTKERNKQIGGHKA